MYLGDNLLELARRSNVAIDAPCSGNGSCGKCRVKLVEGQLESLKSRHITEEEYEAGWRLSCNCKVLTDCTVFVPDIASAYQSRTTIAPSTISIGPVAIAECQPLLAAAYAVVSVAYAILALRPFLSLKPIRPSTR